MPPYAVANQSLLKHTATDEPARDSCHRHWPKKLCCTVKHRDLSGSDQLNQCCVNSFGKGSKVTSVRFRTHARAQTHKKILSSKFKSTVLQSHANLLLFARDFKCEAEKGCVRWFLEDTPATRKLRPVYASLH